MSEPNSNPGEMSVDDIYDALGDDTPNEKADVIDLDEAKPSKSSKEVKDDELLEEEGKRKEAKGKKEKEVKEGIRKEDGDEDEDIDDEVDELEELEDEVEEPSAEKLALMTPVRRAEILKAYPDLFKKFPYLEVAYYREQQFTQIHPTIEDAKLSAEKSQTLDRFESELVKGDSVNLLQAVKEENADSFNLLVDNYLPNLAKVDQAAYHHVIGNVVKHTIFSMVKEARASDNKALESAATILNQYVFGSSNYTPPTNLHDPNKARNGNGQQDDTVSAERKQYNQERFESARTDLGARVTSMLKSTIDANIDRKSSMTDYVKRTASKEALENVQKALHSDQRFNIILDKLWQAVFRNGFKKADVDRINAAYRSKARTLLPSAISKARSEALRGTSRKMKQDESHDDDEKDETPRRKRESSSPNKSRQSDKEDKYQGMSTLEILNSDD